MKTYKVQVSDNGTKCWYIDGKLHREDGPAVEYTNGYKVWYFDGKLHRGDGPAVECANGYKVWYFDGKLHRGDGPAVEDADGSKSWYINGKQLTEAQFDAHTKPTASCEGKVVEVDGVKYKLVKA